jgi:hypothetical protein
LVLVVLAELLKAMAQAVVLLYLGQLLQQVAVVVVALTKTA